MSAIERATPAQITRRLIVLACAVFAVVVAQAQMLMGWGQTPAEFSADSDDTLRVAGYAFSIWGLIYVAILAYAVRQAMRQTGESLLIHRFGWPSAAAFLGVGWWVVAAAFDWEAATVVLIFASLVVLLLPMLHNAGAIRALGRTDRDRWLVVWPLGLLAGWLTVAAPLNLLTIATGDEALPTVLSPTAWAILAIAVVALVALGVTARIRMLAYALPVAWGLLGAFVAEQERNAPLAYVALAAAVAVLVGAVILTFRLRPGIERPTAD
jgi:preprotein translocase subunit Sec61beta